MSGFRRKPAPQEEPVPDQAPTPAPEAVPPEETVAYWQEHCLRAMAEVQNLRRRTAQEIEERTLLRLEGLLSELLRVDDYFAAALGQVPATVRAAEGAAPFLAGVTAIRQALETVLLGNGAVFLEPAPDTPFDPAEHEAVEVREEPGLAEQRLELLARGCRFGRRILRPARVRLLQPPPAA